MQRCYCGTWAWQETIGVQTTELLRRIMQLCKYKFSATTATICSFSIPLNILAKGHISSIQVVDGGRTCQSQCMPHSWCCLVCCINFCSLVALFLCHFSSSLCPTRTVLLSNYPRFVCVLILEFIFNLSAYLSFEARHSFAFVSFSSCALCFAFSIRCLDTFLKYQQKYMISCALTLFS